MADFNIALKKTLVNEGGYSNNPNDLGGETNFGITKQTAIDNGYTGDMKDIPMNVVEKIYKEEYWDKMNLDNCDSQSIADMLFDCCVLFGVGIISIMLQKILNESIVEKLIVDGIIEDKTIIALNMVSHYNPANIIMFLRRDLISYCEKIVKNNPTQKEFLQGWLNRINREGV